MTAVDKFLTCFGCLPDSEITVLFLIFPEIGRWIFYFLQAWPRELDTGYK